jgi:hypothetical protein
MGLTTGASANKLAAMIDERDVDRVARAASALPPATSASAYVQDDFVLNLIETVVDYQMHTTAVVRALEHFRANRWDEVRTLNDLDALLSRYPDDQDGNTSLAVYLWGYKHWRRASELRGLAHFFRGMGVVDQQTLKTWAHQSEFHRDFEGRVKGLGQTIYQWLLMRLGVDTVKPDVRLHRFVAAAVGRPLSDADVIEVVSRAASALGIKARELDGRIWEAWEGAALSDPATPA